MSSRSALAPHHAAIKAQILRLINHASPDDLNRFLEEIKVQQEVLETIYTLWPDLPRAYEADREELADERKEVYILYDAALDDRERIRRRWERVLSKHRWGRHELDELRKCRDYMARNAVKVVGLCVEYAEFSSQIQGLAPFEDDLRVRLEKIYVDERMSTTSKLRKMRNALNTYSDSRRAERYSYRGRSLSPDEDEEDYYVEPEASRGSYLSVSYSKPRRSSRHESKRHRREWDERPSYPEIIYENADDDEPQSRGVYLADSSRHAFRSSSHDTSFLWRSRAMGDDQYHHHNSDRRFSLSSSHLPVPGLNIHTSPEKRTRHSSRQKPRTAPRYEEEFEREERRPRTTGRYLDVPKPKKYTPWEVYEIV